MDTQQPTEPTKLPPQSETTVVSIGDIDQRLKILEKTETRTSDWIKWGFGLGLGIFTAVASIFAGFNWLSAKSN